MRSPPAFGSEGEGEHGSNPDRDRHRRRGLARVAQSARHPGRHAELMAFRKAGRWLAGRIR